MAVLGSDIMIDLHITADTDVATVRGAVQERSGLRPTLAGEVQRTIEEKTTEVLQEHEITDCTLSVEPELVEGRVPGAPRERINARLNVEGDESVLASVDDVMGAPERARIADAAEALLQQHLDEEGLLNVVETTVIVTPVQFR